MQADFQTKKAFRLTAKAQVVALQRDERGETFALLDIAPHSACGGCAASGGCGTSALSKLFVSARRQPIKVPNRLNARVGEQVLVSMDESRLIKYSFMAYGLPLIGFLLFAVFAQTLALSVFDAYSTASDQVPFWAEAAAVCGAIFGLLGGWWLTRKYLQPVLPEMQEIVVKN